MRGWGVEVVVRGVEVVVRWWRVEVSRVHMRGWKVEEG